MFPLKLLAFDLREHNHPTTIQLASMAEPFTFAQVLVVKGGGLKNSVKLPYESVDGRQFIKIQKNRRLARVTGHQTQGAKPFVNVDVFQYMQQRRNQHIDDLIKQAIHSSDPFAEVHGQEHEAGLGKDRAVLFHSHSIPQVIQVGLPAFETPEAKIAAIDMRMLATPKPSASVSVEATGPNLAWFKAACAKSWANNGMKRKRDAFEFPVKFDEDVVKVIQNDPVHLRLGCNYRNAAGKWLRFRRSINKPEFESTDDLNNAVCKLVQRVSEFYRDNHRAQDEDASDDDDEDIDEDRADDRD